MGGPDVPVRIRSSIVQVQVESSTNRPVVAVAAGNRRKGLQRAVNSDIYF